MKIKYDTEKFVRALADFSNATGIAINFADAELVYTAPPTPTCNPYCAKVQTVPEGVGRCVCSDEQLLRRCAKSGRAETHVCHAGLVDIALPIFHKEEILGYLLMGQMRTSRRYDEIRGLTCDLPIDQKVLESIYFSLPIISEERVASIANVAQMLTKYLLLENMLRPDYDDQLSAVTDYIDENYSRSMSIQELSRGVNVSKTSLYKMFRKHFNCTVNEYVNGVRVDKSLAYLREGDMSMDSVAHCVGFSSAAYYSKVFRRKMGVSPKAYKKAERY